MIVHPKRKALATLLAMLLGSIVSTPQTYAETTTQNAAAPGGMTGKCACSASHLRDQPTIDELKKAAEQGDADAQRRLGLKYFNGHGLPQDYRQAVAWYQKAAEQGDAMAQWFLGGMYDEGQGVQHDVQQALHWYSKAAEQGSSRAQFRLGEIFAEGHEVRQNDLVAYGWYSLASSQGDVIALKRSARIAEKFTPEQHTQAKALAAELQAKIRCSPAK